MRVVAFLGRYGNQPADIMLGLPLRDMLALTSEVNKLLLEEAEAAKRK